MSALLTASRLKTARACKRLHHLEYDLGYRALREDEAPRFGTLVHQGLEQWWRAAGLLPDEQLALTLAVITPDVDPFDAAKARALLTGYHLRWQHEPYDVIDVEVQFELELRNPATGAASRTWRLAGKIDVLVKDRRDGLVKLVEHKTTSEDISPGSEYWSRLRMDGQVSIYFDGARSLGKEPAECVYDVLFKPALRPKQVPLTDPDGAKIVLNAAGERVRTKDGKKWRETGDEAQGFVLQTRPETPDEYEARLMEAIAAAPERHFGRATVVRLEAELEEARFDIWQLGKELLENQNAGRYPRNPDACVRYGRTCPFFGVCTGAAALEDTTLFTRLDSPHPELAGQGSEASPKEEALHP